jgi:hypothetical protein
LYAGIANLSIIKKFGHEPDRPLAAKKRQTTVFKGCLLIYEKQLFGDLQ